MGLYLAERLHCVLFPLCIEKIRKRIRDESTRRPNNMAWLSEVDECHDGTGEHQNRIAKEDNGTRLRIASKDIDHRIMPFGHRLDDGGVEKEIVEELDDDEDGEEDGEVCT